MPFSTTTGQKQVTGNTGNFFWELSYEGDIKVPSPVEGVDFKLNLHITAMGGLGIFSIFLPYGLQVLGRDGNPVLGGVGVSSPGFTQGTTGKLTVLDGAFIGPSDVTYIVRAPTALLCDPSISQPDPGQQLYELGLSVLFEEQGGALYWMSMKLAVSSLIPAATSLQGNIAYVRGQIPFQTILSQPIQDGKSLPANFLFANSEFWIVSKPAISSTGLIAFCALTDSMWGKSKLYVVDSSGVPKKLVELDNGGVSEPTWSPDNSFIIFTAWNGAEGKIARVRVDGGPPEIIFGKLGVSYYSGGICSNGNGFACLKRIKAEQRLVFGTNNDSNWLGGGEYFFPGLRISSLKVSHRHSTVAFTARVEDLGSVFTSEKNPLIDHVFKLDLVLGVVDLGIAKDISWAGDGVNLLASVQPIGGYGLQICYIDSRASNKTWKALGDINEVDTEVSSSL